MNTEVVTCVIQLRNKELYFMWEKQNLYDYTPGVLLLSVHCGELVVSLHVG